MIRKLRSTTKKLATANAELAAVKEEEVDVVLEPAKKRVRINEKPTIHEISIVKKETKEVRIENGPLPELSDEFLEKHVPEFQVACKKILGVDPTLIRYVLIKDFPLFLKSRPHVDDLHDKFTRLASAIISQQLSNSAARSIRERFVTLYDGKFPDHKTVKKDMDDPEKKEVIIKCGLSKKKGEYLISLANYFNDNEERIKVLFKDEDNDQEIMDDLVTNIKGIGPWSAKMFLMTGLYRMDIFAPDDVGIARGCANYLSTRPEILEKVMRNRGTIKKSKIKHKKFNWKVYDEDILDTLSSFFSPYRTVFSFLMWRMASTDIDAIIKTETDFTSTKTSVNE
ncbi:DNA-3-methyladenine glycosylase [Nakaseomyces bracarensis]|uniref:DNA-3-methyladenine glycosylase n=1 Tax=Nakaseomyces bracarensis TaxID=273131 RepID=A0ABR4NZK2_9SACH